MRTQPILIACPQYRLAVRGTYQYGDDQTDSMQAGADYALDRVACGQYGGRCMQTLCVLHRYNNRGPGSWYPEIILVTPSSRSAARSSLTGVPKRQPNTGGSCLDVEA
jgi:hypothetical protein